MALRVAHAMRASGLVCGCLLAYADYSCSGDEPIYLDQGWSEAEREQFYYTTQGSQLIPYEWFLALERAADEELFRSDANIEHLGFLPARSATPRNPDRLPIGFVKDDNALTTDYGIKKSFLGRDFQESAYPRQDTWLGLTCAACHTSELHAGAKTIRIDGGSSLADTQQFIKELSDAIEATHQDDQKYARFAHRVLVTDNEGERAGLREEVKAYAPVLAKLVRRGSGISRYGYGRLDAFGSILNEVCETALELPENHYPADAPASYPFLWNTPQLDWVQWNGSAANAMSRNVGEVLGVFAQLKLTADPPEDQYRSTAHFRNLDILEQHVAKVKAPEWPEALLGEIDDELAQEGATLYQTHCANCHVVRDCVTGDFPTGSSDRFIKIVMVPLHKIGTDAALIQAFVRKAKPGVLADQVGNAESIARPALLGVAVKNVIARKIGESQPPLDDPQIAAIRSRVGESPPNVLAYKARPLNGVWATAPFLHNGSAPTLDDLLSPEQERPTEFYVGSRKFDAERVGFDGSASPDSFRFSVLDRLGAPIPGNSNRGHSGHHYTQAKGDEGQWCDFSDRQRKSLIEYMKTLE
jgi:mono/diheme cytochrome c family protein